MTFGEKLRTLREERGFKQYGLAQKVGIPPCLLSRYENDLTQPTLEQIKKLCKALKVSSTELLGF